MAVEGRFARFDGTWYPKDRTILSDMIDSMADRTLVRCPDPRLAILPHSGLYFSLRSFSHLLSSAQKPISHVIIFSPSHYYPLHNDRIYQSRFSWYETPFGNLENRTLELNYPLYEHQDAFAHEHAVEMVMPILGYIQKRQKKNIGLSLFLVNRLTGENITEDFAYSLLKNLRQQPEFPDETLILASSDFTHYGRVYDHTPFKGRSDTEVLSEIEKADKSVISDLIAGRHSQKSIYPCNACGYAAMSIISQLAKVLKLHGEIIDYYHSSDISQDLKQNVSYATVFFKEESLYEFE
ncbi:MAG: AmmeMemoRadiSam system protein B [Sphaerochaetaceae bacterium]|nr:AmmeMemoRadiSam system protein B [Sphaerochaetaceae bacterium]